jgi:serine protease SohB
MSWWIYLFGLLFLFVVCLIVLKKRKNRKKYFQGHRKHPTGHIQYHDKTETRIKLALENTEKNRKAIAVLEFKGDIRASSRKSLSKLIDEIILNQESLEECVVKVESPGGSVTDYGHVYAEMCRIPNAKIPLTVCVDTVAASGGYLAALPANQILASPFAMVGSIGVVSFVPNLRKLLEKWDIQPRTFTAGGYKRTVTLTDDATPEEIDHYKNQLKAIHDQFKSALSKHRPQVDLSAVATGDAWLASTTVELNLKLVDQIKTSSEYLLEKNRTRDIVEFHLKPEKQKWWMQFINSMYMKLLN